MANGHGGKRKGAGAPGNGYAVRRVALSMPPEFWEMVDKLKEEQLYPSDSAVLREAMHVANMHFVAQLLDRDNPDRDDVPAAGSLKEYSKKVVEGMRV